MPGFLACCRVWSEHEAASQSINTWSCSICSIVGSPGPRLRLDPLLFPDIGGSCTMEYLQSQSQVSKMNMFTTHSAAYGINEISETTSFFLHKSLPCDLGMAIHTPLQVYWEMKMPYPTSQSSQSRLTPFGAQRACVVLEWNYVQFWGSLLKLEVIQEGGFNRMLRHTFPLHVSQSGISALSKDTLDKHSWKLKVECRFSNKMEMRHMPLGLEIRDHGQKLPRGQTGKGEMPCDHDASNIIIGCREGIHLRKTTGIWQSAEILMNNWCIRVRKTGARAKQLGFWNVEGLKGFRQMLQLWAGTSKRNDSVSFMKRCRTGG